MVDLGLLLTELPPSPGAPDPLEHVLSVLDRLPAETFPAQLHDVLNRLRRAKHDLDRYSGLPLGSGSELIVSARHCLRAVHTATQEREVQVDLALGADIQLPPTVAAEAESASTVLAHLASPYPAPLTDFHRRFVQRYGTNTPIPAKKVLDSETGLNSPWNHKRSLSEVEGQERRNRVLSGLAQEATLLKREVELDEAVISDLATTGSQLPPLAEVELCAQLLAPCVDALDSGDFLLVVAPAFGSPVIGAMTSRFSHLFREGKVSGSHGPADSQRELSEPPRARLSFMPLLHRSANVLRGPERPEPTIPLGTFADPDDSAVLDPDDLYIVASPHRLHVCSSSRGQEVAPVGLHSLNYRSQAPGLARLLREIGLNGNRPWQPWSWGTAAHLPYLPRVRHRRTVLSPARWRVPRALYEHDKDPRAWERSLDRWRETWGVPKTVQVLTPRSTQDRYLVLDLEQAPHRQLLAEELRRRGDVTVSECPAADPAANGWLAGRIGEVVFPLSRTTRPAPRSAPALTRPTAQSPEHFPGGEWLSAQISCAPEHTNDLIITHLPRLLRGLPVKRWFFVRYDAPHPHLRLRFQGLADTLNSTVLPRLRKWVVALKEVDLVGELTLTSYVPEVRRYGTGHAMAAAERVFCADSRTVLAQLNLARTGQYLPPVVLAAANQVDIARSFLANASAEWFAELPKSLHHDTFRAHRDAALAAIDPFSDRPGGIFADSSVVDSWRDRHAAVQGYHDRAVEAGSGARAPEQILASLLHMHTNRLLGIDREQEEQSLAVARGAVRAHLARRARTGAP